MIPEYIIKQSEENRKRSDEEFSEKVDEFREKLLGDFFKAVMGEEEREGFECPYEKENNDCKGE